MILYDLRLILTTENEAIKNGVELIAKSAEIIDSDLLGNYIQVRLKENHAGDIQEAIKYLQNKDFSLKVIARNEDTSFTLIDVEKAMIIGVSVKPSTSEMPLSYIATFGPVPHLFLMTQEPSPSISASVSRTKKFN